jgi:hypothetical protein
MISKYFEFVQSDLEPVKSFIPKEVLNPKIWNEDMEIYPEVSEQLLTIAKDFYEKTEIEAPIEDIILVGSLANYNWSERYSDYDLHIVIDFKKVSKDVHIVDKLVDLARKTWNDTYDIKIKGYEVEVYIQDIEADGIKSGTYSLLNDKWLITPEKIDFDMDEETIKEKARRVMIQISDIEKELDKLEYDDFKKKIDRVWKKIKNFRKSGLEEEGGEFSVGNLVFKLLRRNGYIGKVMDMKKKSYEKQFS